MSNTATHTAPEKGRILPWITAVLMVFGIAVLAALYWTRTVTVNEMSVSGNYFTTTEEIENKAEVPFGIHPDSLNLENLVDRVESLNYVQKVTPYIEPSGDLELTIQERQPIAMLIKGSDRVYIDAEGVRLRILDGKTVDLPLVYGFRATLQNDTLTTLEFQQVRDFLVGARTNKFGWATISEVAYSSQEGVVALSHENGVKLIFGNDNFETKLRNWEAFYSEVIKTKGIQQMQQVDLRFMNQVVTREAS